MIELNNLIEDGVLFQQEKPIEISGYSEKRQMVEFNFYEEDVLIWNMQSISDEKGYFSVFIPKQKASKKIYHLEVICNDEKKCINDIMIGNLYLLYGQSNIEVSLFHVRRYDQYKEIHNPNIRYIRSYSLDSELEYSTPRPYHPQLKVKTTGWIKADSYENIIECSGLGFFIANILQEQLDIPIGVICMGAGGTPIQAWLYRDDIENNDEIKSYLKSKNKYIDEESYNHRGGENFAQMGGLYNEKIYPIKKINIKAAIWYQGEANAGSFYDCMMYQKMLKTLINRTRIDFRDAQLPILLCNIVSYIYGTHFFEVSYINEAINSFASSHHVFPIPAYDLPYDWTNGKPCSHWVDWHPIHPSDKYPYAKRIAKILLNLDNRYITYFSDKKVEGNAIYITFEGTPLNQMDEEIVGFTISDEQGVYYQAQATIIDSYTVKVSSKYVKSPSNCCYGFFLYNNICNLYNQIDIPVLPFRTAYEAVQDDLYYTYPTFLSCDFKDTLVINGPGEFGGAYYQDTWHEGSIIFGNVSLSYDTKYKTQGISSLRIDYKRNEDTDYYFGVSPSTCHSGQLLPLKHYRYLSIDLAASENTEFFGMFVKIGRSTIVKFHVNHLTKFNLTKEFQTYVIDLTKGETQYVTTVDRNMIDFEKVHDIQFTFRNKEDCIVHMDNLILHNAKEIK